MGLFFNKKKENKKENISYEFDVTREAYPGFIELDEDRGLMRVKEIPWWKMDKQEPFAIADIKDYEISCNNTTVTKKNLRSSLAGAALFGPAGLLLGSSRNEEYITKMEVVIKLKDTKRPIVRLPILVAKVKVDSIGGRAAQLAAENILAALGAIVA